MIQKTKNTLLAQMGIRFLIFVIFFIGVFVAMPSFLVYLLILLIFANFGFGFVNESKSVFTNLFLFFTATLLFVFLIEYLATITGSLVSLAHLIFFAMNYYRDSKDSSPTIVKKK